MPVAPTGPDLVIRPVTAHDIEAARTLMLCVMQEMYGHLVENIAAMVTARADIARGWVALSAGTLAGVAVSRGARVDDLWVLPGCRGSGIGGALLATLEREIAARGETQAVLRVVGENTAALRFYTREGWRELRRYPHEKTGDDMVDMAKQLTF